MGLTTNQLNNYVLIKNLPSNIGTLTHKHMRNSLHYSFLFLIGLFIFSACGTGSHSATDVIIKTDVGDIHIDLYDDTPKHKENFLKLVDEKYYDGVLFKRVIRAFMVQAVTKEDGSDKDYTLAPEFNDNHIHVKGAVAAAREPDNVNPEKRSSGAQFYIVTGKKPTPAELGKVELHLNAFRRGKVSNEFLAKPENAKWNNLDLERFARENSDSLKIMAEAYNAALNKYIEANMEEFSYSQEQRDAYARLGGAPHLDGSYTVFGEVTAGMDIVQKIESSQTQGELAVEPVKILSVTRVK